MRIFQVLFRRKNMPNGHIWRGKRRLVKEVTHDDVQKLRNAFEIEEKNMFYLRHSYLTPEQSHGHAIALGITERRFVDTVLKRKPLKENVTIESRLGHLKYKEGWD